VRIDVTSAATTEASGIVAGIGLNVRPADAF